MRHDDFHFENAHKVYVFRIYFASLYISVERGRAGPPKNSVL